MDDCIILGNTPEELEYWTRKVLDIMHEANLSCKPIKCQFEKSMVKYLGTFISHRQLAINPLKVAAISEWLVPKKVKDVKSFLGTMNFWRKFIKDFSSIAHPLNKLQKKDHPFEWTSKCQQAFDLMKIAITTAPVLKTPRPDLPYLLETDASGFAVGAVLSQQHDN
jgi:hypothetical protein